MKKHIFLFFVIAYVLLATVPIVIEMAVYGNKSYVERKVGFHFSKAPTCIYSYDKVGEGREWDVLAVYEITADVEQFESFLQISGWNALPLPENIVNLPLCEASFDGYMDKLLSCNQGYWYCDGDCCKLMVYDIDSHIIYIRRSTLVQKNVTHTAE